jgi:hypothetical protein
MLGLLLRFLLMVVTLRFLGGLLGAISPPPERAPDAPKPLKPLVDRASAIDVPFTEERTEP